MVMERRTDEVISDKDSAQADLGFKVSRVPPLAPWLVRGYAQYLRSSSRLSQNRLHTHLSHQGALRILDRVTIAILYKHPLTLRLCSRRRLNKLMRLVP